MVDKPTEKTSSDCEIKLSREDLVQKELEKGEVQLASFSGSFKARAEEEFGELNDKFEKRKNKIKGETCDDLKKLRVALEEDVKEFKADLEGMEKLESFSLASIGEDLIRGEENIVKLKDDLANGKIKSNSLEEDLYKIFGNTGELKKFLKKYKEKSGETIKFPCDEPSAKEFVAFYKGKPVEKKHEDQDEGGNDEENNDKGVEEEKGIFEQFNSLENDLREQNLVNLTRSEITNEAKRLKDLTKIIITDKNINGEEKKGYLKRYKNVDRICRNYKVKLDKIEEDSIKSIMREQGINEEKARGIFENRKKVDREEEKEGVSWNEQVRETLKKMKKMSLVSEQKAESLRILYPNSKVEGLGKVFKEISQKLDDDIDIKDIKTIEDADKIGEKYKEISQLYSQSRDKLNSYFQPDKIKAQLIKAKQEDEQKQSSGNQVQIKQATTPEVATEATSRVVNKTVSEPPKYPKYRKVYNVFKGELSGTIGKRLINLQATDPEIVSPNDLEGRQDRNSALAKTPNEIAIEAALGKNTQPAEDNSGIISEDGTLKMEYDENGNMQLYAYDKASKGTFPIKASLPRNDEIDGLRREYSTVSEDARISIEESQGKIKQLENEIENGNLSGSELDAKKKQITEEKKKIEQQRAIQRKAEEEFKGKIQKTVDREMAKVKVRCKNVNEAVGQTGFHCFKPDEQDQILKLLGDPMVDINLTHRLNAATMIFEQGKLGGNVFDGENKHIEYFQAFMRKMVIGNEQGTLPPYERPFSDFAAVGDINDPDGFINGGYAIETLRAQMQQAGVLSSTGVMNMAKIKENLAKPLDEKQS